MWYVPCVHVGACAPCTVCVGVLCTTLLQAYANNSDVVISTGMVRG